MAESKAHRGYGGVVSSLETPPWLQRLAVAVNCTGLKEASYACASCNRKFSSRHALSGHQNAHSTTRKRRRQGRAAPSSSSPAPAVSWLPAGGGRQWRAYDRPSAAATVVDWTEAAAAPELDLTLKLWFS